MAQLVLIRVRGPLEIELQVRTSRSYLGLNGNIARVNSSTVRDLALAADSPMAEAVFLSCTNLRTLGVLRDLQEEMGKPVLSANQVSLWAALRAGKLPATLNAGSLT